MPTQVPSIPDMALNLSTQTPVEIDTVLAALSDKAQTYRYYIAQQRSYKAASFNRHPERQAEIEAQIAKYQAVVDECITEAKPYGAEFARRGGWNRYYLVNNTNGHVHRGMDCSTCFDTTQYRWIIDLADCDEAAMVAEYGELACTVCFPDAPTFKGFGDGTSAIARYTADEKAQRAAEKAQRAAVKAAKTLEPELQFKDLHDWRVETVAAAKQCVRDTIEVQIVAGTTADYNNYNANHLGKAVEIFNTALHALSVKGVTDEEIAKIIANAEKRVRKDYNLPTTK